jgi:hypothetical protein
MELSAVLCVEFGIKCDVMISCDLFINMTLAKGIRFEVKLDSKPTNLVHEKRERKSYLCVRTQSAGVSTIKREKE